MNPEYKGKSVAQLRELLSRKMNELFELRSEISRRTGDVPGSVDVDYTKYVEE